MRLFIGVPLPTNLKEKILDITKKLNVEGVKLIPKENLHITLSFLGEVDDVGRIKSRLRDLPSSIFKIRRAGVFPSIDYIRVVWLGVDGGMNIVEELKKRGFDVNDVLHVTIARVKRKPNKKHIKDFIKSVGYVGEFKGNACLFKSVLMKPSPKYINLFCPGLTKGF